MNNRYVVRHESGDDYEIVDTCSKPPIAKATGLSRDEAETAAEAWNEAQSTERAGYV